MKDSKTDIHPGLYLSIAKTCREMGEIDLGIAACERGSVKFPDNESLYYTRGFFHVLKFNITRDKNQLKLALKIFEKSLSINPHNYLAKLHAGQIYFTGGILDKAKEKFNSILKTAPDDQNALKFLKDIKLHEDTAGKLHKDTPTAEREPHVKDIEVAVHTITEGAASDYKVFIKHLNIFKKVEGVNALFLLDNYGNVIKNVQINGKTDTNIFSAVSANIFRSSQTGAEKIGFGEFKTGLILSSIGNIYILNISGVLLSILTSTDINSKLMDDALSDYCTEIKEEKD